ncbi:hypothetical protein PHSY_001246 [Pseudozyma hubeiensis SY62]|uniref:Uncharacterized protein n=1 Tax=Pseudozyma hubeiensis (strain SY62) TaxID=1305764 RepID=R9NYE1_PSEHS|nr:hypothetical protein PHSY_001246 [Pseudozyma hubeiensis SY62]GAC93681.1 hypothetical protein PHSY_001246 [Pseudozyma hubeiensis SY62]
MFGGKEESVFEIGVVWAEQRGSHFDGTGFSEGQHLSAERCCGDQLSRWASSSLSSVEPIVSVTASSTLVTVPLFVES